MEQLTTSQAAAVGAAAGGIFGATLVFAILFCILLIVAMWKLFAKAGEKGWKSLIPIYNGYILYKISGMKNWFWYTILVAIVCGVVVGLNSTTVQTAEGVSIEYNTVGTIFLFVNGIFQLVAYIMLCAKLSKAFGRGAGTAIGLFVLPNIFTLILGFGSAKYDKKALK